MKGFKSWAMWDFIITTTGKRDTRENYSNKPPYTDPYVRWCEGTGSQLMATFPLDSRVSKYLVEYFCSKTFSERVRDRSGKPGAVGEDLERRARPEGERPTKDLFQSPL
jgi:hypothetical protein